MSCAATAGRSRDAPGCAATAGRSRDTRGCAATADRSRHALGCAATAGKPWVALRLPACPGLCCDFREVLGCAVTPGGPGMPGVVLRLRGSRGMPGVAMRLWGGAVRPRGCATTADRSRKAPRLNDGPGAPLRRWAPRLRDHFWRYATSSARPASRSFR